MCLSAPRYTSTFDKLQERNGVPEGDPRRNLAHMMATRLAPAIAARRQRAGAQMGQPPLLGSSGTLGG